MMETRRKMKLGTSDKVILGVGYTLLGLFVLAVFVPLVYVVLASFMDPNVLNNQGLSSGGALPTHSSIQRDLR